MSTHKVAVALVGLVLGAGALAQGAPAAAPESPKTLGLSDPQKLEKAEEAIVRMKSLLKQVLSRLEDARGERDVVKLNCVNEKLAQIKGLLKVAEQSDIALQEAVAKHEEGADSEFAKVGIARVKVEQLRTEAEECIGQLAFIVDEKTTVEVEEPKGVTERDLTDRAPPPLPLSRPPAASGFE